MTAAMGWFEPGFVRSQWTEGAEVASPRRTARHYAQACAEWGEKHLADIDHIARLVSLAERVADSAEGSGLPLFSGWRAEPRPELLSSG